MTTHEDHNLQNFLRAATGRARARSAQAAYRRARPGRTRLVPTLTTELLEIPYADGGRPDGPPCCCCTAGRTARAFRARSVPTLLVHGGSDACIALEQTERTATDPTAGCRPVVVRGAGHVVPRAAPGTVADLILDRLGVG